MLVTFKTQAYSDITMFGSAAQSLLKLMGLSGHVPGALMAEDVPEALQKLKDALAKLNDPDSVEVPTDSATGNGGAEVFSDEEKEPAIGLDTRALPLISLLEAAVAAKDNVLWES